MLSYRELADRLGIAVEAAKARARRGGWARLPGNDGMMRVQVPIDMLDAAEAREKRADSAAVDVTELVAAHAAELERLAALHEREVGRLREQAAGAEAEARRSIERAAIAETTRDQVAVTLDQVAGELARYRPKGIRGKIIEMLARDRGKL